MTLSELIAKLEEAEEGSRELDCEIYVALGNPLLRAVGKAPRYSSSLDAALTLVPEGSYAKLQIGRNHAKGWAWVELRDVEAVARSTPALALCIAALKARG
jgi:hypothetical protein